MTRPSCSGPCQQGKKPCPTPSACQTPSDDDTKEMMADSLFRLCLLLIAAWVMVVVIAPAIAGWLWELNR